MEGKTFGKLSRPSHAFPGSSQKQAQQLKPADDCTHEVDQPYGRFVLSPGDPMVSERRSHIPL